MLWRDRLIDPPSMEVLGAYPRILAWCCGQIVELTRCDMELWEYMEPEWDNTVGYSRQPVEFRWWMLAPKPPEEGA